VASGKGLLGAGYVDEGQKLLSMASRESTTEDKLINALTLQGMRNDGRIAGIEKRQEGRAALQEDQQEWKSSENQKGRDFKSEQGEANRGAYGGAGKSSIKQEQWDIKKLNDHVKGQPQFYSYTNDDNKVVELPEAEGTYRSLIKKLGPDRADSVMHQAWSNAKRESTVDGELDSRLFKNNYLKRVGPILEMLNKK
jgi:hypothetical protein